MRLVPRFFGLAGRGGVVNAFCVWDGRRLRPISDWATSLLFPFVSNGGLEL